MRYLLIALLALCAGCAGTTNYYPVAAGESSPAYLTDLQACKDLEWHSRLTAALLGGAIGELISDTAFGAVTPRGIVDRCLRDKGWQLLPQT